MSLSNVLVNGASFMMSKSNSWHDFKGTVSSYNKTFQVLKTWKVYQHIELSGNSTGKLLKLERRGKD